MKYVYVNHRQQHKLIEKKRNKTKNPTRLEPTTVLHNGRRRLLL